MGEIIYYNQVANLKGDQIKMDDQLLNLFGAITSGMDHKQREEIIEILRNPPTGRTPADLVQLLDLKKIIDELTRLNDAYKERDWQDIDGNNAEQVKEFRENYFPLHRQIIDYFNRINYSDFSSNELDKYDSIQKKIIFEGKLNERKIEIQKMWDFYHEVAALPDQIRQLPAFNLQRAANSGTALVIKKTGGSGEVTEDIMSAVLYRREDDDPEHLHGKWFLAKLFIEQQPTRIEAVTKEVNEFERSFQKSNTQEKQNLTAFKKNQNTKYCTQNYQIVYNEWCMGRFKELLGK